MDQWDTRRPHRMEEPMHMLIYRDLVSRIAQGQFEPGDKLPTESELQQYYEVSRTPVRQALGQLENEGLITRQPGRGTFVQNPRETGAWGLLSGFGTYYRDDWDQISSHTLWVKWATPSSDVAEKLALSQDEQVVHLRRKRHVGEEVCMQLDHYFPGSRFDAESFEAAGDFFSMRIVLRERFKVVIRSATEDITAVCASPTIAAEMGVSPGSPLLFVERISHDWRHQPVQLIQYFVRSDLWQYRANLQV